MAFTALTISGGERRAKPAPPGAAPKAAAHRTASISQRVFGITALCFRFSECLEALGFFLGVNSPAQLVHPKP